MLTSDLFKESIKRAAPPAAVRVVGDAQARTPATCSPAQGAPRGPHAPPRYRSGSGSPPRCCGPRTRTKGPPWRQRARPLTPRGDHDVRRRRGRDRGGCWETPPRRARPRSTAGNGERQEKRERAGSEDTAGGRGRAALSIHRAGGKGAKRANGSRALGHSEEQKVLGYTAWPDKLAQAHLDLLALSRKCDREGGTWGRSILSESGNFGFPLLGAAGAFGRRS